MPVDAIGVEDDPSGLEIATRTFGESALTKHLGRMIADYGSPMPSHSKMAPYSHSFHAVGGALDSIIALWWNRASQAEGVRYITRITVRASMTAATGVAHPLSIYRQAGNNATGGSTFPGLEFSGMNKDTGIVYLSSANVEGRTNPTASTNTRGARPLLVLGTGRDVAVGAGGWIDEWKARSLDDAIVIVATGVAATYDGLMFLQSPLAATADVTYHITIEWMQATT